MQQREDVPPANVPFWRTVWAQRLRYRDRVLAELALALPPTVVVLVAFLATSALIKHPILFGSLASSAFLIYRAPGHRMNRVRVMLSAQLLGWAFGIGSALIFGPGYLAGALAMVATIIVVISLDVVHPPSVATALGFSLFGPTGTLVASFVIAVSIIAALALLQKVAILLLARVESHLGPRGEDFG
ncbi:MAG TPA: HPP family protein [Chloroflexota bacterium]|nr:HPP family protein [Chloroflexota bacterium]